MTTGFWRGQSVGNKADLAARAAPKPSRQQHGRGGVSVRVWGVLWGVVKSLENESQLRAGDGLYLLPSSPGVAPPF